ncbi:hypothetical protein EHO98_05265 [Leptospira stimsonii]|uniref:Uncharacterized protein n=1 Tax=Leptospira stimsonii TaxID=2202203 RepID=A0ABY2MWD0_9LEPT|nr:hypothetical protein EHO98_05265 [Leptospira stimsonii]TGM10095.1 hypothetical protein EHQ90_19355 [Leptospira stimsonii]
MSAFLLWFNSMSLRDKIYAILFLIFVVTILTVRGVTCASQFINKGGYDEVQDVELSPSRAYDSDCVPEPSKPCP